MISRYKFFLTNFFFPRGKVSVKLGSSELANKLLSYFNKRIWKRGFIKLKKYNIALLPIEQFADGESYISSVNGKNSAAYFSRRSSKLGYSCAYFNPNEEIESIYEINISSEIRQGKTMDESYKVKVSSWPYDSENKWFGVYSKDGKLVAYVWLISVGEMILINRILGHKEHLNNNVMYLLLTNMISNSINSKDHKFLMYDTFGRSYNGLVLFKKRIGFHPYTVNFEK